MNDVNNNSDIKAFENNLTALFLIKSDLETGRKNLYELNEQVKGCLEYLKNIPVC